MYYPFDSGNNIQKEGEEERKKFTETESRDVHEQNSYYIAKRIKST